jgi:hypothetical protein
VEKAVAGQAGALPDLWRAVRAAPDADAAAGLVDAVVARVADATLTQLYPGALAASETGTAR